MNRRSVSRRPVAGLQRRPPRPMPRRLGKWQIMRAHANRSDVARPCGRDAPVGLRALCRCPCRRRHLGAPFEPETEGYPESKSGSRPSCSSAVAARDRSCPGLVGAARRLGRSKIGPRQARPRPTGPTFELSQASPECHQRWKPHRRSAGAEVAGSGSPGPAVPVAARDGGRVRTMPVLRRVSRARGVVLPPMSPAGRCPGDRCDRCDRCGEPAGGRTDHESYDTPRRFS